MRDDLLGVFNGNKARKLEYFLSSNLAGITRLISHGSSQSNAMYSLSLFAKIRGLKFSYVVSHLSLNLRQNPVGNFKFALENDMELIVCEDRRKRARELACEPGAFYIEEGVAMSEAEQGFIKQAKEIEAWAEQMGFVREEESNLKHSKFAGKLNLVDRLGQNELNLDEKALDIFLPSGTGASATYLARNIKFNVYTCPCVGDINYLKSEIAMLDPSSRVHILPPPRKYHFGDLRPELYDIWRKMLQDTGVEFDLIYDPVGLLTLSANLDKFRGEILYIHQGGQLGNISQLARYERKSTYSQTYVKPTTDIRS